MNEYVEILISIRKNKAMNALKVVLWFVCVMSLIASILGLFYIIAPLALAMATGVGAYFVGLRVYTEYEYILTDKELDIDIIYAKSNRKRIKSIDLDKMEVFAREDDYHLDEYRKREMQTFDYSSKIEEDGKKMFVMYCDGARYIFEPDEELINAIYNISPRKVYKG